MGWRLRATATGGRSIAFLDPCIAQFRCNQIFVFSNGEGLLLRATCRSELLVTLSRVARDWNVQSIGPHRGATVCHQREETMPCCHIGSNWSHRCESRKQLLDCAARGPEPPRPDALMLEARCALWVSRKSLGAARGVATKSNDGSDNSCMLHPICPRDFLLHLWVPGVPTADLFEAPFCTMGAWWPQVCIVFHIERTYLCI